MVPLVGGRVVTFAAAPRSNVLVGFRKMLWALTLVAGCAAPPAPRPAPAPCPLPGGSAGLSLRVGVEVLEERVIAPTSAELSRPCWRADRGADADSARASAPSDPISVRRPARPAGESDGDAFYQAARPWALDDQSIDGIEDGYERTAMQFVQDLVGEDRRRVERTVGAPVLITRIGHLRDRSLWTGVDDRIAEDEAAYQNRVVRRLLRSPLRDAAIGLSGIRAFENDLAQFKRDNVPLTSEWQEEHTGVHIGGVTGRLRPGRGDDTAELGWKRRGLRVGSSLERLRLRYKVDVAEGVRLGVRWKKRYTDGDDEFSISLDWQIDADTRVHVIAADRVGFLDGPTDWTHVDSPADGHGGVMFWVERLF